ncbi:MAG: phosphoenolpyruvate synthase [Bryobacteraceae bacterium]
MSDPCFTLDFEAISMADVARVGGKNASLGEMFRALKPRGVGVLDGFATTSTAWRRFLEEHGLERRLQSILSGFDPENVGQLAARGHAARAAVLETPLPPELAGAIVEAQRRLASRFGRDAELAVRSSATAEDLPEASFAGAAETFLNVRGSGELIRAVHQCFASLYTDRAISYRARLGFPQLKVALSVGVMPMVRSDLASSGVIFTLDTESGFRDVVTITGAYGLGEFVVQGVVTPDEWLMFKPTEAIVGRRLGSKQVRLVYAQGTRSTRGEATPEDLRRGFCLSDPEVRTLGDWACIVEEHYSALAGKHQPMDLEWAKDGISGELFILQARPETVHSRKQPQAVARSYRLTGAHGAAIVTGQAVGERIGSGPVRVVRDLGGLGSVQPNDVLVAVNTDPDWEPAMRKVAAIVTDQGGRTAHAAIVSREFGIPCVVGTGDGTRLLSGVGDVTVCCAEGSEGRVYEGRVAFSVDELDARSVPETQTRIQLTVGDPSRAFRFAAIPNQGVGLARIEFIINNHVGIHPMALVRYPALADPKDVRTIAERIGDEDPREFFVRRLSEGVARIGAAFYPKPVLVRTSDFKTNEYAQLTGGREFEPVEENPMIGFRGASRYYHPAYADGFALECAALRRVRGEMGLTNVQVMIPFCRTLEEGRKVLHSMAAHGLTRGDNGLEIWMMCEIPSNVVLAGEFLRLFDGYSIGSNDLTQLTLGLDRDSAIVAPLFDENNPAVRAFIDQAIQSAHRAGKPIGICGQAPSDFPEFAEWLVERGIDSISLNPDTAVQTALRIAALARR